MSADFSMGKSVLHAVARAAGKSSERKRLLKLCVRKLQGIEDPETFLCRSVLINNTLRNLQTIQREAKLRRERDQIRRTADWRTEAERGEAEWRDEAEEDLKDSLHVADEAKIVAEDVLMAESDRLEAEEDALDVAEDSYSTEDILNDIVMPLPLSPTLEDLDPLQQPLDPLQHPTASTLEQTTAHLTSSIHLSTAATVSVSLSTSDITPSLSSPSLSSPLLSSNSSLSSGWMDREEWGVAGGGGSAWTAEGVTSGAAWTADWTTAEESILWSRSKEDVTATLDLDLIVEGDGGSSSEASSCSGEEEGEQLYDAANEVQGCGGRYNSLQPLAGINVINSLIASLES